MNILNLEKGVSLYEINNEFYFDLEDLANKMGYSKPKDAIRDFKLRNSDFHNKTATCGNGRILYDEPTLYYFLMRSNVPKAKEWQHYICTEVLPLVRQTGLKAIKELVAAQLLAQNRPAPELLPKVAELVDDPVDFLLSNNAYRVLGYVAPSDIHSSVKEFWDVVEV